MKNVIFDKTFKAYSALLRINFYMMKIFLEANLHINHTQRLIQANVKNMCLDLAANNNNHLS